MSVLIAEKNQIKRAIMAKLSGISVVYNTALGTVALPILIDGQPDPSNAVAPWARIGPIRRFDSSNCIGPDESPTASNGSVVVGVTCPDSATTKDKIALETAMDAVVARLMSGPMDRTTATDRTLRVQVLGTPEAEDDDDPDENQLTRTGSVTARLLITHAND